jgi:hypothetical protein
MRYLIRALKYLVYFAIIFFLIVGIVFLFSHQKAAGLSFVDLFKEGSLPKIALFFVAVSALYPKLSFYKKEIYLNGDFTKYAGMIDEVMKNLGYKLESNDPGCVTYIKDSAYARLTRMYEDRVTFETADNPIRVEGYRKDLLRILSAINYRVRQESRETENAE